MVGNHEFKSYSELGKREIRIGWRSYEVDQIRGALEVDAKGTGRKRRIKLQKDEL